MRRKRQPKSVQSSSDIFLRPGDEGHVQFRLSDGCCNLCNLPIGDAEAVMYSGLPHHKTCIVPPTSRGRRPDVYFLPPEKPLDLRAIKKTWWWIESPDALNRFSENPFAQGYELLRRIGRFCERLTKANCPPNHTWKQLYSAQKDCFSFACRGVLTDLNLRARTMAGPGGICFDATKNSDYLLKSLRFEIRHPTPFVYGVREDSKSFRISAVFAPHPNSDVVYTPRPDGPSWHKCRAPGMVYVSFPRQLKPLCGQPMTGKDRKMTDREVLAYFRNFIKENPPKEFKAYRKDVRKRTRIVHRDTARTLSLGLMANDYVSVPNAELKDLADWIFNMPRLRKIYSYPDSGKLARAIYHAKAHVDGLSKRALSL